MALLSTRITNLPLAFSFLSSPLSLIATLLGYNMPVPYRINQAPGSDQKAAAAQLPTTEVRKIYPPCDVEALQNFSLEGRKRVIFSCAQFRYVVDCVQITDTK